MNTFQSVCSKSERSGIGVMLFPIEIVEAQYVNGNPETPFGLVLKLIETAFLD